MKKIAILIFIVFCMSVQSNFSYASTLSKTLISKHPVSISELIYNPISKNLYYVTPNGSIFVLNPSTKKLKLKIDLGDSEELYDHTTIATLDKKNGKLYVSFNRTLYVINGITNKIENKIHLIRNPKEIIVKSNKNKIWLLYPDLRTVGIIDDVLSSKKNPIRFIDFAKMTEYAYYDSKRNGVYLHDARMKYIYFLNDEDSSPLRMNYRKHLKFLNPKPAVFNSVLENGEALGIKVSQIKSPYKEKEFFWLDESLRKLFISLNNSLLVFNLEKNDFEPDIENLPPCKWAFTDNEKLFLIFRLGITSYYGLGILDLKTKELLDLTVLDLIEKITYDDLNKTIYASTQYSENTPSYLLTVNANSLNKKEFLSQLISGLNQYQVIIGSNKDKRMIELYKNISLDIKQIKLGLKGEVKWGKGCSLILGDLVSDIRVKLNKFVTPCRSKDDLTKACIDYRKLIRLTDYLESILAVDFNQNNINDICENVK